MADRQTPEDDEQDPNAKTSYVNPGMLSKAGATAAINKAKSGSMNKQRKIALMNRLQAKNPNYKTPHQLHVLHQKHVANVKNNPRKYGKKLPPFLQQ